ncbi:MAG: BtpA/SgcQ family protein [Planctomycetota bacterium]
MSHESFVRVFGDRRALIGMVHVPALPGTPRHSVPVENAAPMVAEEAALLVEAGFDAVMLENMHDAPYLWGTFGPEVTAAMTRFLVEVRTSVEVPLGVQVLSGGHREALAVALAGGADFIRCENFVFSHVADEGLIERASAGELMRYRRSIGAEHIAVFADIKKKHASHAITGDLALGEAASAAEFFGADGVIVSGTATAMPTEPSDIAEARSGSGLPVLVGSGVTPDRIPSLRESDALIVGSWYKEGGRWDASPDAGRARQLVEAFKG